MTKPIAWTIAGSDSGGGAGIQADLHTFQNFGVHACSVITAITAQNSETVDDIFYVPAENIFSQLIVLANDLAPQAIKIGMLGHEMTIERVKQFLVNYSGKVVLDPICIASARSKLFSGDIKQYLKYLFTLFPYVDVLTPNLIEAQLMLGRTLTSYQDIENAAEELLNKGVKSVLIKGGHFDDANYAQDYWTNGTESFWLSHPRISNQDFHGSGCCLSSAIAANLALGYDVKDALVLAKIYVNYGMRHAQKIGKGAPPMAHEQWTEQQVDLPYANLHALTEEPVIFPDCGEKSLGLYPVVDSAEWIERLAKLNVSTLQLRIKNKTGAALEDEIKLSIAIAQKYSSRLFINDYWDLALKYDAYGLHLGQGDLHGVDFKALRHAGIRLGISTHNFYELARAHALRPSYIACGPIFSTSSKSFTHGPVGITQLQRWRHILNYPLVAIGGITQNNINEVIAAGANGAAVIAAITQADDYQHATEKLLEKYTHHT